MCFVLRPERFVTHEARSKRSLDIAPKTVKSHVKHIVTKLNVEKRAQAVSRAQILGLAGTSTRPDFPKGRTSRS
jgi:Bacterial regulatory proteins, luxR family